MLETLDGFRKALERVEWNAPSAGLHTPVLVVDRFVTFVESDSETVGRFNLTPGEPWVAPLSKSPHSSAFLGKITVGRAGENDIHLQCQGVSKFHAYFENDPELGWVLVDGGSTYGTYVEDVLVSRQERVPLSSGARIRFGGLRAVFYNPPEFVSYLQTLKRPED
ncbi:MAG: FHA domain-containing protein [Planctomycetota bacterium]